MARRGKVKVWLIVVLILVALIGFVVYSFTAKARDLGVRYTEKDLQSMLKKAKMDFGKPPTSGSRSDYTYKWTGKVRANAVYTQEEITAWLNLDMPSYVPYKNVQIKLNKDGTIEASANINFKALEYYLTPEERKYIPSFIPASAPVYGKLTGYVENNVVHLKPESVVIGVVPVPKNLLTESNVSYVERKIESLLSQIPNLYIETLKVQDGKIIYKGTEPAKLERIKNP
jgi:hypothetical protein